MAFDRKGLTLIGSMAQRRRLPKELQAAVDKFAAESGKAIWAWNYCHAAFFRLFGALVRQDQFQIGAEIWQALRADSSQRDILLAAAKVVLAKQWRLRKRVIWAKRRADALAEIRNVAAHMATNFTTHLPAPAVVPDSLATSQHLLARLEDEDLHKLFAALTGDLISLAAYVMKLQAIFLFPGQYAWPRRPRQRAKLSQVLQKPRRRLRKLQQRPPRSSRA